MTTIQRLRDGQWTDFITIHDCGRGEAYRVVSSSPSSLLSGRHTEIISLIQSISHRYATFRARHDAIADDRVGAVMEDIEYGRLDRMSTVERQFLIALAMLGFDTAMLIAETE